MGPLSGVVVVDFSRVLSGPYATMILGDLGADVTTVERPDGGDLTRSWGPPFVNSDSSYYLSINRNKRSVALDLGNENDRATARRLCEHADVLVQNFRPGTMERWGLGYAQLSSLNPGLVYCSISAFGSQGDASQLSGYDLLIQAASGLMSITGQPGGRPTKVGVPIVDVLTGLNVVVGALAALQERERSGIGQHVETNLLSCMLAGLVNQASSFVTAGVVPKAMGNEHPSIAPYELLQTRSSPLVVAVGSDRQFRSMCAVIGADAFISDARFITNEARVSNRAELRRELERVLATRDADEWVDSLSKAGVPCGRVNDIEEAFRLAEKLGMSSIVDLPNGEGGSARSVANPLRLSRTPVTYRTAPPQLGEHTEAVVRWLEETQRSVRWAGNRQARRRHHSRCLATRPD